jgi:hypothetical protein
MSIKEVRRSSDASKSQHYDLWMRVQISRPLALLFGALVLVLLGAKPELVHRVLAFIR